MDNYEQLEFKYYLNRELKRGSSMEMILSNEENLVKMSNFLAGKIGRIWLKSRAGQLFQHWQQS